DGAGGDQGDDEARRHNVDQGFLRAAVDAEGRVDRVEEAADAGDLLHRQDGQNPEDGNGVEQNGQDAASRDRLRHVALRVLHFLGGPVLQLEADVVEDQQRYQADEDGLRG